MPEGWWIPLGAAVLSGLITWAMVLFVDRGPDLPPESESDKEKDE